MRWSRSCVIFGRRRDGENISMSVVPGWRDLCLVCTYECSNSSAGGSLLYPGCCESVLSYRGMALWLYGNGWAAGEMVSDLSATIEVDVVNIWPLNVLKFLKFGTFGIRGNGVVTGSKISCNSVTRCNRGRVTRLSALFAIGYSEKSGCNPVLRFPMCMAHANSVIFTYLFYLFNTILEGYKRLQSYNKQIPFPFAVTLVVTPFQNAVTATQNRRFSPKHHQLGSRLFGGYIGYKSYTSHFWELQNYF